MQNKFSGKTVGQILKDNRQALGLTLREVSGETKIKQQYLEALENCEYDCFESQVYTKGILKNYAKYLGLNVEQVMGLYRREQGLDVTKTRQQLPNIKQIALSTRHFYLLSGLVLLFLFGLYMAGQINRSVAPPQLDLISPVATSVSGEQQTATFITEQDQIQIKGKVYAPVLITVNGTVLNTNADNEFSTENIPLAQQENKIKISAVSQFGSKTELLLSVSRKAVEQQVTDITANLSATKNGKITVQVDDQNPQIINIVAGKDYNYIAQTQLQITFDNTAAATINVNNQIHQSKPGLNKWILGNGMINQ